MKKYTVIIFAVFAFALFGYRSLPSEAVGFSITHCDTMPGLDCYYVSFPFVAEGDSAHTLYPDGDKFRSISRWDNYYQAWYSCSYFPFLQVWASSRFPIYQGYSYVIASIQNDFEFTKTGAYEILPQYDLITSEYGSADMNLIMVPLEKYDLYMAGSGLGNDIGSCNRVVRWDPTIQASQVTQLDQYGFYWQWDYPIKIADPIYVNMTADVTWPYGEKKGSITKQKDEFFELNSPKAVYHAILNSSKEAYDFGKDGQITFKAWVTGREDDMLTDQSFGCGFEQAGSFSTIYINLGNFKNKWQPGDILNFEVTDQSVKGNWMTGKGTFEIDKSSDAAFRGFEPLIKGSGDPIILNTPTGEDEMIPYETALYQNYPNPFNPVTTIKFSLENDCDVKLRVFNYKGQVTNLLVNGKMDRGFHSVQFNADMLSSGVYFYTLEADGKKLIRKMVLVR